MNEVVALIIFVTLIHMGIDWLVKRKRKRVEKLESRFVFLNNRINADRISQSELDHELSEITKDCRKE